jgi:cytochrome P450
VPLLGNIPEVRRKGVFRFYLEAWHRYGDLFRVRFGPLVMHGAVHPDHVQQVLATRASSYERGLGYDAMRPLVGLGLLTSTGDLWTRQRRLIQPHFTVKAVQCYDQTIHGVIRNVTSSWDAAAARGEPIDMLREMLRLTLSTVGLTTLGIDLIDEVAEVREAFELVMTVVATRSLRPLRVPLAVPTPENVRFKRAVAVLHRLVDRVIRERRAGGHGDSDRLIEALQQQGMDDQQLRDEVITLIIAGYDTTALTLCWAWYLLAMHPAVQGSLQEELDAVVGDGAPTVEQLGRLPRLHAILAESMRLYPVTWIMARNAKEEDEISGYEVPAGSLVGLIPFFTHRHPEFWDNPNAFQPERFAPDRARRLVPGSYFPFGAGPRRCMGSHLATLETQLAVAAIASRYRVELMPGWQVTPEPLELLRIKGSLPMRLTRRRRAS